MPSGLRSSIHMGSMRAPLISPMKSITSSRRWSWKLIVMGRPMASSASRCGWPVLRTTGAPCARAAGAHNPITPMPMMMEARAQAGAATKIDPGEQKVSVSLGMVFELQ